MINPLVRSITKDEAIALMGEDRFGDESCDFYTDGMSIEFNDGQGTIWEIDIRTHWSEDYMAPKRYERHCGDSPECCWTEWEEVD